jgi:hypothetical protein
MRAKRREDAEALREAAANLGAAAAELRKVLRRNSSLLEEHIGDIEARLSALEREIGSQAHAEVSEDVNTQSVTEARAKRAGRLKARTSEAGEAVAADAAASKLAALQRSAAAGDVESARRLKRAAARNRVTKTASGASEDCDGPAAAPQVRDAST